MAKYIKMISSGICAGIMVSIGGCIFLASSNTIVGGILFSVALVAICAMGFSLYTGKIGYLPTEHSKENISVTFLGLLGNLIGTCATGAAIYFTRKPLAETAAKICESKLEQSIPEALIRAILCGILMYVAVNIWRDQKSYVGIFVCIPVFVISGFEHSIADMFYFATAGNASWRSFGFILLIILGNSIGGMLFPVLMGKLCLSPKKEN